MFRRIGIDTVFVEALSDKAAIAKCVSLNIPIVADDE